MPKIQWTGLPPALRGYLFERLRERKISADDFNQLNRETAEPFFVRKLQTGNIRVESAFRRARMRLQTRPEESSYETAMPPYRGHR